MSTNSAVTITGPMDPTDEVDYVGEFGPLLESGETIVAGFTVAPTTESATLGFEIGTTFPPALEVGDKNVVFWCEVNPVNQADAVFNDDGVIISVEITVNTTLSRQFQRTFLITAKQL